tara:strand:- start:3101 stop:3319 length:219 start_codon:yes stop_codon:yes gene_type:complete
MDVIYGLLPGMLLLGIIGVGLFFWAVRSGQYDDMDGAANRILMDDPQEDKQDKDQTNDKERESKSEKKMHDE